MGYCDHTWAVLSAHIALCQYFSIDLVIVCVFVEVIHRTIWLAFILMSWVRWSQSERSRIFFRSRPISLGSTISASFATCKWFMVVS